MNKYSYMIIKNRKDEVTMNNNHECIEPSPHLAKLEVGDSCFLLAVQLATLTRHKTLRVCIYNPILAEVGEYKYL